jgi:RimJ/RimL family protein N-acetyltransferase
VNVLETERLNLRRLTGDDAEFVLELLNDASFIKNIADRGVRSVADARRYIVERFIAGYEKHGFGMYLVELKKTGAPAGICGLVKRDELADVDIGFAFLPRYWSKGYALESASAVKAYALDVLGLKRLVAITNPDNVGSIKVLERIGLRYERMIRLSDEAAEIRLYACDA